MTTKTTPVGMVKKYFMTSLLVSDADLLMKQYSVGYSNVNVKKNII